MGPFGDVRAPVKAPLPRSPASLVSQTPTARPALGRLTPNKADGGPRHSEGFCSSSCSLLFVLQKLPALPSPHCQFSQRKLAASCRVG